MSRKQKKELLRIIVSAVTVAALTVLFKFVELNRWIQAVLKFFNFFLQKLLTVEHTFNYNTGNR